MAGRRDDSTPGSALPGLLPAAAPRRDPLHTAGLVAGLLLALAGTAAVILTDDARFLRVALLATCWAFLVAAFLAGGRRADQVATRAREAELRHAYDLELQREVAARKAHEVELERRLRREAEQGMRRELAALRADLSGLSGLHTDLTALGELRSDLARLRSELTEQLSGELLIERMVMRAQAVRLPADRSGDDRPLGGATAAGDAARTTGWERTVERRADGWALDAPVPPVGASPARAAGPPVPSPVPAPEPSPASPAPAAGWPAQDDDVPAGRSVPAGDPARLPSSAPPPHPSPEPAAERPSPAPRNRYRAGLDALSGSGDPAPPRHRRAAEPDADRLPTGSTRAAAHRHAADDGPAVPPAPAAGTGQGAGSARLDQILAGSGVNPAPGRRRRRYRDEDGPPPPDDVLARVLGRP